ncbi:SH3 domain-containing protein [Kaistella chaponensis]|uniref:SH3 domain-containing protein n=1 Tax=Kaistella chaponensis TaxID=713588 RepID=A0A1N7MFW4_9FLAO|nr:C40 family peptidase [Kaistella chaponensis]SIS84932.1 SH3 domain-containing protein [Kaistella chaponensis]
MEKGICTVSVAAIRAEQSHQSEMTSQILYGETVDILEKAAKFIKIKMHFDGYEGWVDVQQISEISEEYFQQRKTELVQNTLQMYSTSQGVILLSIGSEVNSEKADPIFLKTEKVSETAQKFFNVPYLWSGRSFFGIDCSGFVQLVYKVHGISLPREAHQQSEVGEVLSFVEESKPGDLAFFENLDGQISHVGMLLEDQNIIHAYGKVRIDSLDSTGIFNKELNKHTHKLRFLRSVF